MYRVRNFIYRLRRGISWFVFSFKQSPWQEDYQLFETIEKVLLDTATYFEQRKKKGWAVSVDNDKEVAYMRLAAKLIKYKIDEHYWSEACKGEYNSEIYRSATKKDDKALRIAMKIISERGFYWWI